MASNEFNEAYVDSGTIGVVTCSCGITHFVNSPDCGVYDDDEYDDLLRKHNEKPDKFIMYNEGDSISYGVINGEAIIMGCGCKKADRWEDFIWNHRYMIKDYLNAKVKLLRQDAENSEIKTDLDV